MEENLKDKQEDFKIKQKDIHKGDLGRQLLAVRGETIRYTELGWRKIIFLPFNPIWLIVITAASVYVMFVNNYCFIYKNPLNVFIKKSYTITWLVFIIDVIFSIWHRVWERVNRSQRFRPKSWLIIFVDIICAHPLVFLYSEVFHFTSRGIIFFIIIVNILRLYRIFVLYDYLKSVMGLSQLLVHLLFYNFLVILLADIFSIIWYVVEEERGDTTLLMYFKTRESKYFSIHFMLVQLLLGSSINTLYPSTSADSILVLFPILFGHCLEMIYTIVLLVLFLKQLDHNFTYKLHLEAANKHLVNIGIKKEIRYDFLNFYYALWDIWWGIKREESLDELPLSLRKEVLLDLCWDAIQHSRALRFQGINFKRDLALRMSRVMSRPGDYILNYGDIKNTMLYIVSGHLQVMSQYDSTIPLISFSSGTILGGSSIILPNTCKLAIRSLSYSEVITLGCSQLFEVALKYPWEAHYLLFRAFDRLQDAFTMMKFTALYKTRFDMYKDFNMQPEINTLGWVKKRWKLINSYDVETYKEAKEIIKDIPIYEQFTSKYLDLYVISEDLELKKNRFCLEAGWPFVIEPECDFLMFWNSFILCLALYDSVMMPYYAVFAHEVSSKALHLNCFTQFMYIVDTCLNLITAVRKRNIVIMNSKKIVTYKLKQAGFYVDFLSSFPLGTLVWIFGGSTRDYIIWTLFRLFKTWRVLKMLMTIESGKSNLAILYWIRHVTVFVFIIYWSSCIMFFLSCSNIESQCNANGWVEVGKRQLARDQNSEEQTCFSDYLTMSLYYTMTVTGVMDSSYINTNSVFEAYVIVILTGIINSYFLYFTAHIMAIELLSASLKITFINLVKNFKKFARSRDVPDELTESILDYIDLQWERDRATEFVFDRDIFYEAPAKLYAELTNYFIEVLKHYRIFTDDSEGKKLLIAKLAEKARMLVLPSNFLICAGGYRPTCLTILRKGYCRLTSHLEQDIAQFPDGKLVGAGSIFPLVEVICQTNAAVTIYTVTNCECIVIDELDFRTIWKTFKEPTSRPDKSTRGQLIKSKLSQHFIKEFHPTKPIKSNPSFILRKPFFCTKSNILRMLLHIMFPKYCFSPTGKFLFYWEFSRFVIIPLSIMFFMMYFIFVPSFPKACKKLDSIFDILSAIDIYFRFNTGYYNKNGIFIKDVCKVVKKYLTTAFLADFISAFPWENIIHIVGDLDFPWTVLTVFKSICMYRFIRFSQILAKREKYVLLLKIYTVCVSFTLFLIFISCNALIYRCQIIYSHESFQNIQCKTYTIFSNSHQFDSKDIVDALVVIITAKVGTLFKMKSQIDQAKTVHEMRMCIVICMVMNLCVVLFLAKCCKWAFTGTKYYIVYRQNVENLINYLHGNLLGAQHIITIQRYFRNLWEKGMPKDIATSITKLHPTLKASVMSHLYYDSFRKIVFLKDADEYLFRALSTEIQEVYVIKGQVIAGEYDITKSIYIVVDGGVVVSLSKISPALLGPGCIFGALQRVGIIKHIYSYEASKNTSLFKITSQRFHEILEEFPEIYNSFLNQCLPTKEYIITGTLIPFDNSKIDLTNVIEYGSTTTSNKYLFTYKIITSLVAYLTIVLVCLVFIFNEYDQKKFIYSFLVLDLLTLWKIITQWVLPYVDSTTGLTVKNKALIRKKYMKTKDFYIDVITIFPYFGNKYLALIKLLRVLELSSRNSERRALSFTKTWEVWVFYMSTVLFTMFLGSVLCAVLIGKDSNIFFYNGTNFIQRKPDTPSENFVYSALLFVIIYCRCGRVSNFSFPDTKFVALITSSLTAITLVIIAVFLGYICQKVQKITWKSRRYQNNMMKQRVYLKYRDCSPVILESIWLHFDLMWQKNKGENLPVALDLLPFPLQKEILYDLFAKHIESSYLFKQIHLEFIKNLCTRVQQNHFFPGESIVVEGDVDNTMYFIITGEVDVLKTIAHDENELVGILTVGESFGLCQGLYECRPHPTSYKARTSCEILSLKLDHWKDLMLFFTAQTRIIYRRAAALAYEYYWDKDYKD